MHCWCSLTWTNFWCISSVFITIELNHFIFSLDRPVFPSSFFINTINPFQINVPFLYPLKTLENQIFQKQKSVKKVFLKISQNSQENTRARIFFKKTADFQMCNFIKRLQHRCFPMNTAKVLRTALFTEHLRWLVLNFHSLSFLLSFNAILPTA